jgi:HPr kinase/phosphorylase
MRRPWARASSSACRCEAAVGLVHASTVAFGRDAGILILGPSGAGKSTLALRLIAAGAQLVADDRTIVVARRGRLFARAPRAIAGRIEARGLGIVRLMPLRLARLRLIVDLAAPPARMPPEAARNLEGVTLPLLPASHTDAFAAAMRHYVKGLSLKA